MFLQKNAKSLTPSLDGGNGATKLSEIGSDRNRFRKIEYVTYYSILQL